MEKINIVIVDDHSIIRQGVKQILELEEFIKVIGEAGDGQKAIETIISLEPDVALLDINMPVFNGIEVIKKLKELKSRTKIILFTIHSEKEYLQEALNSGAIGYVLKDAESHILIESIKKAYKGESYIPSDLATELIKDYGNKVSDDSERLTDRETEVLKEIARGRSNKEIACELSISEKTVKNHISNIFRKLDINDRTQAAIYAIGHGIK